MQAAAAAKGIADLQQTVMDDALADSEEVNSDKDEKKEIESADPEDATEEDARRKAALQKLESASEDSFLGQVCKHCADEVFCSNFRCLCLRKVYKVGMCSSSFFSLIVLNAGSKGIG